MARQIVVKIPKIDLKRMFYTYLYAADRLAWLMEDGVITLTNKEDVNLIIPYLFLLRHSIEVLLKIVIFHIKPEYKIPGKADESHSIQNLYRVLCGLDVNLEKYIKPYDKIVSFFNDDIDGTLYRYTIDKVKKTRHQYEKPMEINITETRKNAQLFFDEIGKYLKKNYPGLVE